MASLVLGRSLPEGTNAAYVLVEVENNPSYLVNPCNGNRYQLDDTTCPLFQICTVITSDNVYGNIQPIAHCAQMEFNFAVRILISHCYFLFSAVSIGNLCLKREGATSRVYTKSSFTRIFPKIWLWKCAQVWNGKSALNSIKADLMAYRNGMC
jgi:hypothetical protein